MKRYIVILFVLCGVALTACSVVGSNRVHSRLVGKWQWIRTTGGFVGMVITPDSVGYESYTVFEPDHTYSVFRADTLVKKGKYRSGKEDGEKTISYEDIQYFPPRPNKTSFSPRQWIKFRGSDTLVLMDQCYDCYISTYVRVR